MNVTTRWVAALLGLLAVVAHPGALAAAGSERVWVIANRGIGPYEAALRGFDKGFGGAFQTFTPEAVPAPAPGKSPHLVVAIGVMGLEAALKLPPDVPIIFLLVLRLNRESLAGRSYVGIQTVLPVETYLAFVRDNFPALAPVGLMTSDPQTAAAALAFKDLKVEVVEVTRLDEVPRVCRGLAGHVGSMVVLPDPKVISKETTSSLLFLTSDAGRPLFTYSEALVNQGAMCGLVASYEGLGIQAAELASRGATAILGRMEIVTPKMTAVYLNGRTARKLGVEIPEGLKAAARIIE